MVLQVFTADTGYSAGSKPIALYCKKNRFKPGRLTVTNFHLPHMIGRGVVSEISLLWPAPTEY